MWVDEMKDARYYLSIRQPRAWCTSIYKEYPQYGVPVIVELEFTIDPNSGIVISEPTRVKNSIQRQQEEKLKKRFGKTLIVYLINKLNEIAF
jgi:hypothetical protein